VFERSITGKPDFSGRRDAPQTGWSLPAEEVVRSSGQRAVTLVMTSHTTCRWNKTILKFTRTLARYSGPAVAQPHAHGREPCRRQVAGASQAGTNVPLAALCPRA
jgi:hypothetical protein